MNEILEPVRQTPVMGAFDVVVAGGGPAGVAAALAAARTGASTLLVEAHGQLGGVWTSGMLSWVLDAGNKQGVMAEMVRRLNALHALIGARVWNGNHGMPYDVEQMKRVLEELCLEAGVTIRLHSRIVAVVKDERRMTHVMAEGPGGREAFAGKTFVDCTGNGDLAALAGCGFDIGRPAEGPGSAGPDRVGETQPMTLMCMITGIDREATAEFHDRTDRPWSAPKDALRAEFNRAGVEPSYGKPTIFEIHPELYTWMINHEYGYDGLSTADITAATLHARAEVHKHIDALRKLGGVWRDIRIVATPAQIGIREGRRIHGRYTVTVEDMIEGARFDDAICRVTFGLDVHSTNKTHGTGIDHSEKVRTQPYDVPLRSLIAADVDGLLTAGRCISGDFLAHSSYRVTGNSVAMGEAAGACAAVAATTGRLPHEVPFAEVAAVAPGLQPTGEPAPA
ncbi:MAG: FAD-dependent oxidoreductase [Phycisphaerae bacterium]